VAAVDRLLADLRGDVKPTQRHESPARARAPAAAAHCRRAAVDSRRCEDGWLFQRFLTRSVTLFWIGTAITAAALSFSAWARMHLGRNWSATVTVKQDHELIRTVPTRSCGIRSIPACCLVSSAPRSPSDSGGVLAVVIVFVLLAQTAARGALDERDLRRGVPPLSRTHQGARSVPVVKCV